LLELLGAHPILNVSRIRVNVYMEINVVCSNMKTKLCQNLEGVDDTSSGTCGFDWDLIVYLYFRSVIGNKNNSKDGVTS
jgi:hypothetical protein